MLRLCPNAVFPLCRLAPIRGIPTKKGMEDPNQDLLEIFQAVESIPSKGLVC
jgi:hypothetical protein